MRCPTLKRAISTGCNDERRHEYSSAPTRRHKRCTRRRGGRVAVARRTRPFTTVAAVEENAPPFGIDRSARGIAEALHLRGGRGVASVCQGCQRSQQQRGCDACEEGAVCCCHAAMVRRGHEEWLNNPFMRRSAWPHGYCSGCLAWLMPKMALAPVWYALRAMKFDVIWR